MEITKTQTQIIVYELVLIFLGVTAILRNQNPQQQVFESAFVDNISTVTVSSIYGQQKKGYSPAKSVEEEKQEKSVTITFDPKESIYKGNTSGKGKKDRKYKKTYRRKPTVRRIYSE